MGNIYFRLECKYILCRTPFVPENPEAVKRMGGSVLGHKWSPTEDVFTFQRKVYMGKKTRNFVHTSPQLLPENLDQNDMFEWTKAVVLLTVALIFNPSGLISAYLITY